MFKKFQIPTTRCHSIHIWIRQNCVLLDLSHVWCHFVYFRQKAELIHSIDYAMSTIVKEPQTDGQIRFSSTSSMFVALLLSSFMKKWIIILAQFFVIVNIFRVNWPPIWHTITLNGEASFGLHKHSGSNGRGFGWCGNGWAFRPTRWATSKERSLLCMSTKKSGPRYVWHAKNTSVQIILLLPLSARNAVRTHETRNQSFWWRQCKNIIYHINITFIHWKYMKKLKKKWKNIFIDILWSN